MLIVAGVRHKQLSPDSDNARAMLTNRSTSRAVEAFMHFSRILRADLGIVSSPRKGGKIEFLLRSGDRIPDSSDCRSLGCVQFPKKERSANTLLVRRAERPGSRQGAGLFAERTFDGSTSSLPACLPACLSDRKQRITMPSREMTRDSPEESLER